MDKRELGENGNYKNLFLQKKKIDCFKLFKDNIHDEPAPPFQKTPFQNIPKKLLHEFTYGNRILMKRFFFTQDFPRNRNEGRQFYVNFYIKHSILYFA